MTGSPSCQRASGRRLNVQVLPVGSTVQRVASAGHEHAVGAAGDEALEHERDEVAVGLRPGAERVDGDDRAKHALAVRGDLGRRRRGRGMGRGRHERRRADHDGDDAE